MTNATIYYLLVTMIPALIAKAKGRSFFLLWWVYGAVLFVFALAHTLLMEDKRQIKKA